jgi:hypothetical protein
MLEDIIWGPVGGKSVLYAELYCNKAVSVAYITLLPPPPLNYFIEHTFLH